MQGQKIHNCPNFPHVPELVKKVNLESVLILYIFFSTKMLHFFLYQKGSSKGPQIPGVAPSDPVWVLNVYDLRKQFDFLYTLPNFVKRVTRSY